MKRIFLVIVIVVAVGIVGLAWWLARGLFGEGTSPVKRWCAQQIQSIADDLIRPTLQFDSMDFEFPGTAIFHQVSLRDGEIAVVEADVLRIKFANTPRAGKPVVIEEVHLVRPVVRLLRQPDGTLAGVHDFVRSTGGQTHEDGGSTRPSDVFAIRLLGIESGTVIYREASGDTMQLDDITMQLGSKPRGDDPGSYDLTGSIMRPPLLELDLNVKLDIDTSELQFRNSKLQITLGPEEYGSLPPQVQQIMRQHEISGEFVLTLSGLLPLADTARTALGLEATLTDGHAVFDKYVLPIKALNIQGRQTATRLDLNPITLAIYDGTVEGSVDIHFDESTTIDIDVHGKDLQLEQALRTPPGEQPRFAGIVTLLGSMRIQPGESAGTLGGSGSMQIRDGRLLNDPVFGGVVNLIRLRKTDASSSRDSASTDFQLFDDRVHLENAEMISDTIACVGSGDVYFDSRLDLVVRGGYARRAQLQLGEIGKLLAGITDQVAAYRVGGTTSKPTFSLQPLGLSLFPN